ncbi:hypothetical protein Ctha_2341 [Chloroherpeton thalassium ATCC 35110]|uniref:Dynamin N-terminal domain-containing protein n=1 Tax=Chloroherpeton thalassium (strain ATCC 35110 / GB-78) TaxID=517418 RepID=B3QWN1_CHLT3|nr:dynamin family protein [Chloroherpeton thalassium]ACF14791.1 hypothetical protein Ctha_2341 [Chloroherpeton thalassium ATCC 35110]
MTSLIQQDNPFITSLLRVQQIIANEKALNQKSLSGVDRLNLAELVQKRFTVAVVGQMRSGKSTLINALVQKDIAPTAVNECTATTNHFLYSGKPELHRQFRVRWKDDSEDYLPLTEVENWIGKGRSVNLLQKVASKLKSKNTTLEETKYLDFFADTPFLKTANIVDTPGLRSTVESHESTILSYISQTQVDAYGNKLAEETRSAGESADAVVYVLNPVARQNDADILELFGDKTRLAGSNPYNSMAVVHMWENDWQDIEVDPATYLEGKIRRIEEQLRGKVSLVMAASGLLSRCLDWLKEEHWAFFAGCASLTKNEVKRLTSSSVFETREGAEYKISLESRKAVIESLKARLMEIGRMNEENAKSTTMAIIRFLCRFACVRQTQTTDELKRQVREMSGVDRLETLLEKLFFARASLIKNSTLLTRIWEPCRIALLQLENYEQEREDDVAAGQNILRLLDTKSKSDTSLLPAVSYVKNTFQALSNEAHRVKGVRKELYTLSSDLKRQFESFEEDMGALESLDSLRETGFTKEELEQLRALFGAKGLTLEERLMTDSPTRETVQQRYAVWAQKQRVSYGEERKVAALAQKHLEGILDSMSASGSN